MKTFSRRDVLKLGVAGAGTLMLPKIGFSTALASPEAEPHFFLQIFLNGGADSSYLFDARPLEFTAAGKMQNYLGKEPYLWTGANGQACYASELTHALVPFKDRFSILNGVMMATTFDGHPQNLNFFMTGNAFGGESFVPHLNMKERGVAPAALDAVQSGSFFAQIENGSSIVPLEPDSMTDLNTRLKRLAPATPGSELNDFIRSRMIANAQGSGRFSVGSAQLAEGWDRSPDLHARLLNLSAPNPQENPQQKFVSLISDCFRQGVARSAVWVLPGSFDVHAANSAKTQPDLFKTTVESLTTIFKSLAETPFDSKRSIFDVTTVMVGSEFSRTMRQSGVPIDQTGTNHNVFNNSILLGGKGIKNGLVVGESDRRTLSETLSGAHKMSDKADEKLMGRPFDFAALRPRTDLPAAFDINDYLTMQSVVNTVYSLFNVPKAKYRITGRQGPAAPVMNSLLA